MSHQQRQHQSSTSISTSGSGSRPSGRPGGPGTPLPSFAELMQSEYPHVWKTTCFTDLNTFLLISALNIDDTGRLSPSQRASNSPPSRGATPRVPAPQATVAPSSHRHHLSATHPPAGSHLVLDARSMRPVTPPPPRSAPQADGGSLPFRCEYCGRGFDRRSTLKASADNLTLNSRLLIEIHRHMRMLILSNMVSFCVPTNG